MFILVSSTKFSLNIVLSETSLSTQYSNNISSGWQFIYEGNTNTGIYRGYRNSVTVKNHKVGINVLHCQLLEKGHWWESEGRKEGGKRKVVFVTITS